MAAVNFSAAAKPDCYPSHWFLVAALFLFPWIYSTANLFIVGWPVRGVVQAVDRLVVRQQSGLSSGLSLVGLGTAFYFLPKFAAVRCKPIIYALFAFWTLLFFGSMRAAFRPARPCRRGCRP